MRSDAAYEYAWQHAARNDDGSIVEDSLIELVADSVDFDEAKERRGLAQRIVARRKRPGQTAAEGAVVFPGMEPYAYEPHRLIADDAGNLIENRDAKVRFKAAEATRAQQAAQRAMERAAQEQRESGFFATWVAEQLEAGRDKSEITWDTCVRETGLWKDTEGDESDVDDEGEAS